jgi:hypothetical protein
LNANINVSELRYGQWTLNRLQTGDITLRDGRLVIPDFTGQLDGQPLNLALDLQPVAPWSLSANFNLPRLPLTLLKTLPQLADFPHRLDGFVGISGNLTGTWKQPLALQGGGQVVGRRLQFDQNTIEALQFNYQLKPGELNITGLQASVYRGRITGSASLAIGDKPGGSATLDLAGIDAAAAAAGLGSPSITARGALNGSVQFTIPPGAIAQRQQWTGAAELRLDQLNVFAWQLQSIQLADMQLANGQFRAPNITAQLDGQPLRASATLDLQAPFNLSADFDLKQLRVDRLTAIPQLASLRQRIAGLVDLTAHVDATLEPLQINARGTTAARGLAFDNHRIDQLAFAFNLTPQSLAVSNINAQLYGGQLSGDATIPLSKEVATTGSINWSAIDAGRTLGEFAKLPFSIQGNTNGNAKLTIPPGQLSSPATWDADLNISLPNVVVNRLEIASITARLAQHNRQLTYHAEGTLFAGTLQLEGTRDANAPTSGLAALGNVQLRLNNARLGTAVDATLVPSKRPTSVDGTFSLNASGSAIDAGWSWRGDASLSELTVANERITPGVTLRLAGVDSRVMLEQFSGEFAGGQLSGSGQWRFDSGRGVFRVGLRNARIEQLYALTDPTSESPVTGPIDINLNVHPSSTWRIAGAVASPRLEAGGLRFSNVRIPVDVDWSPATNRARLYSTSISTSLAGGRVAGRLSAESSYGLTLDGNLRFTRVDVGVLSREIGSQSAYGRGRLTGTLTMTGRDMHSINDLRARLAADLDDTQATSIPVVSQLQSFIPGFAIAGSGGFQQGRLEAHLARGVVHVDRLSLASSQMQLYVTGLLNLPGRLRLDATVALGQGNNPLFAQLLLTRLAAYTVPPAALLIQANDFLANRVIHAEIGGTISRPVVRLQPLKILREELVRFFLREATGAVLPPGIVPAAAAAGSTSSAASSRR